MVTALSFCAMSPAASSEEKPMRVRTDAIPEEVMMHESDWPLPNRDYANTRATEDAEIDSSNVSELGVAWSYQLQPGLGAFGSASTTPIILGNDVYVQDLGNNIHKLDLATGEIKWRVMNNWRNAGPNGVVVAYRKVIGSCDPYTISAYDAEDGSLIWESAVSSLESGTVGVDIQPTAFGDKVLLSTVPGSSLANFYAGGSVGVLYALDQETGEIEWSFRTVKGEDIWGNPDINSGGGTWYSPAVDIRTGMTFWSVANPAPFPGVSDDQWPGIEGDWPNGTSRPGPNLYTNSLAAFPYDTGKLEWYNQVWPHDIADYDLQLSPILTTATVSGKRQEIVISGGKMGYVYAFNRRSGELLWTAQVGEYENDLLTEYPVYIIPATLGGVETPMAYSDGIVYVPLLNLGAEATGFQITNRPFSEGTGELVALKVDNGRVVWKKDFPTINVGGATVVNDLVITGTLDGMIYAFDKKTGEEAWSYRAPAGINGWPAIAGDTIVWPIAGPGGVPSIIAFSLEAQDPIVEITSPKADNLPAGDITVETAVYNFDLVARLGEDPMPEQGHLHYYLDYEPSGTQGEPAIPEGDVQWSATKESFYTFSDVTAGDHVVYVQLVNNDHTPLDPPVIAEFPFTAETEPRLEIVTPTNGAVVRSGELTVEVEVTNFGVTDALGESPVKGEGHVHYYLNVEPPTTPREAAVSEEGTYAASAETSYTWQEVEPGKPVWLYAQLVNNDHTPLDPPVTAELRVIVASFVGGLGAQ